MTKAVRGSKFNSHVIRAFGAVRFMAGVFVIRGEMSLRGEDNTWYDLLAVRNLYVC